MSAKSVVLWAEDDDNDVLLVERALMKVGVTVQLFRVGDGMEATEYLSGEGKYSDRGRYPVPALILLDIKMPRMSGFDVLEWKLARPAFRELPVVMMSSSSQDRDKDKAYRLGAQGYLVKPSNFDDLILQVKKLQAEWL